MKCLSKVKGLAVSAVAVAGLLGPVQGAQAVQFSSGDAVLAVYGNSTEYVANLGTFSSLITNGVDLNLSSIMGSVGGTNVVKYTIFGYDANGINFGNIDPASSFTAMQKNQTLVTGLTNTLITYSGQLSGNASPNAPTLFAASDPLSFSSNLNAAGSNTLGGNISSAHAAASSVDVVLNLLTKTSAGVLSTAGTALLSSSTGHFVVNGSVSAVPLPAAAVLFATGMIGLVGVARRRVAGL